MKDRVWFLLLITISIACFFAGYQYAKTENTFIESSTDISISEIQALTRINPNTANEQELDNLPGVGPVLAKRIIEHRQQNGAFTKIEDLLLVKGIGNKMLNKIKPYLSFEE